MENEKTRKKIVIFEDDSGDFRRRYKESTEGHEVIVYAKGIFSHEEIECRRENEQLLRDGRITQEEYQLCLNESRNIFIECPEVIPEADLYFTDGLSGDCFYVLHKLPKDRAYLVSGDDYLMREARDAGFRTAEESEIENIINGEFR